MGLLRGGFLTWKTLSKPQRFESAVAFDKHRGRHNFKRRNF
jgi:hypothetical protein